MSKAKYEVLTVDDKEIIFDVTQLMKEESVMINATKIANQFGKRVQHWLDTKEAQDYISAVARRMSKPRCRLQENLSSDTVSQYGNSHNENYSSADVPNGNLVKVQKGGKYSGTWIHSKLAIVFARWLDADFAVMCDEAIERMIRGEQQRKEERLKARTGYAPLTLAIQSANDEDKFYHYSNEANLINRIVLGMDAKEYKEQNSIGKDTSIRDMLSDDQLAYISALQQYDTVLLQLGNTYSERKDLLMEYYVTMLSQKGKLQQMRINRLERVA